MNLKTGNSIMKKYIYIAFTVGIFGALTAGCEKDNIKLFDDPNELYFE